MEQLGTFSDLRLGVHSVPAFPHDFHLPPNPVEILNGASLYICPGTVMTWEEFVEQTPEGSFGLDGLVSGRTRYDLKTGHANFNHHEGADRMNTRSTAGQIDFHLRMGFLERFCNGSRRHLHVFFNHLDHDSMLASWLVVNREKLLQSASDSRLEALIALEGRLDASCGMYPATPGSELYRQMIWIFTPYTDTRVQGRSCKLSSEETVRIVSEIHYRISRFFEGRAQEADPDLNFRTIFDGSGWSMVEETGAHCRHGFLERGIEAFVSYLGNGTDRFHYSMCKSLSVVPFPIKGLYKHLNKAEGIPDSDSDRWNGSDICGGSPRIKGSRFAPAELGEIIEKYVVAFRSRNRPHDMTFV